MGYKVGDEVVLPLKIEKICNEELVGAKSEADVTYLFKIEEANRVLKPRESKTYEQGLADAWELAKRFAYGDLSSPDKRRDIFGNTGLFACMNPKDGVEEVIFTVESYEKKKSEFKVGDEVKNVVTGNTFWVIAIEGKHMDCYSSFAEQNIYPVQHFFENFDFLKKTGRTTDAIDLLRQIGE